MSERKLMQQCYYRIGYDTQQHEIICGKIKDWFTGEWRAPHTIFGYGWAAKVNSIDKAICPEHEASQLERELKDVGRFKGMEGLDAA